MTEFLEFFFQIVIVALVWFGAGYWTGRNHERKKLSAKKGGVDSLVGPAAEHDAGDL